MSFKHMKELVYFAGGLVFGTAGIKVLASKDAKKAYVHTVAAGLRMKESLMDTVGKVQENAEDVLAEARYLNDARAAEAKAEAAFEDEDGAEAAAKKPAKKTAKKPAAKGRRAAAKA